MMKKFTAELQSCFLRIRERQQRVPMSVHRSIAIGQKASATMLEVNGELLLLGVTNSAVTLIQRWQKNAAWEVRGYVR